MATIQERTTSTGETRYRALVRVKGSPTHTATFRRKTDAKRWAQKTEADIRRGKFFASGEARRHTFAELVDDYLVNGLHDISTREQESRRRHLSWWKKELGKYALTEIGPRRIAKARKVLATQPASGRSIRAGTQNRYLCSLSTAFRYGIRELEWLESNPVGKVSKRKEPRGRQESSNPHLYLLILLAISTGMRRGELLSLRWCDLDLDRGSAIVHDSKNGDRRAVPLAGPSIAVLRDRSKSSSDPQTPVFQGRNGSIAFPRGAWESALKEAGVADFRFHDCRHTAASYVAQSGARLHEIAEILGHRTLAMVKRYAHLTESHTLNVARRMADQFLDD